MYLQEDTFQKTARMLISGRRDSQKNLWEVGGG